jgi:hypothetical protein
MNFVLTTYFTSEKDPQSSNIWSNDDFTIIKKFYDSIVEHDLNCIILIDNSSDAFIEKYKTDKIQFVRCDSSGLNMIDIRWKLYHDLLSQNTDISSAFFLDVSDVVILKNPFNYIQPDKIYCGDEEIINQESQWMLRRYKLLSNKEIDNELKKYLDKKVINAGILGGNRDYLIDITGKISNLLLHSKITHTTVDMCAFNHVLYTYYRTNLVHGLPVNTVFRADDSDNKIAWFKHK